jgi:hypothetical protein
MIHGVIKGHFISKSIMKFKSRHTIVFDFSNFVLLLNKIIGKIYDCMQY